MGPGVARLTVRNVGTMVSLVNSDTSCGFASPGVLGNPQIEGVTGSAGSITFTVNNCVIDLGAEGRPFPKDCNGTASTARGKITVSATRRIEGTLTGRPETPIIPGNADAVTITLTNVTMDNFQVRNLASENVLTMLNGSLSATAKPRLAVSESSGACAIATPNVTFSNIVYTDANVHLLTPDNSFDVPVPTSDIDAQNGVNGSTENDLSGSITVFDSPVALSGDLDPDYDAARFVSGYACAPDLQEPVSYQCADITPRLADGAARLSVKMMGTITSMMDANTSCGFTSPTVLGGGVITGTPGGTGTLVLTAAPCTMEFATTTSLTPGCDGSSTTVKGSITVSGTKTVTGRFTGNATAPIAPTSEQPATFDLEVTVNAAGFKVGSTADGNALEATTGTLNGTTKPRVFQGNSNGFCSVSSPHAEINAQWTGADLLVTSSTGTLALDDVDTDVTAINGSFTGRDPNTLTGTVTVGGESFDVPTDGSGALNPAYTPEAFEASWVCGATQAALVLDGQGHPNSSCQVAAIGVVNGGIAALSMKTLGTVVSLIDATPSALVTCGFKSPPVGGTPSFTTSSVGDDGVTATFTLASGGCSITIPADTTISTDCLGGTSKAGGTIVVRGTKKVTGWRTGSPADPIVPNSSLPAEFDLTVDFTEFVVKSGATGSPFMTVHSGALTGKVNPRTALDPLTNACSKATPNLTFSDVVWTDGSVTLNSAGSLFNGAVSTSNLHAQNGNNGAATPSINNIGGSITVDGVPTPIADGTPLDRAYSADNGAAFNSTYQCAGNGSPQLVPTQFCSFKQVLGNAAARILSGSVATATSVSDGSCFQPNEVITGGAGTVGSSTAAASACAVSVPTSTDSAPPDCSGAFTRFLGDFTVSGTRNKAPAFIVNATTAAPFSSTAVTYNSMSYAMDGWRFEKMVNSTTSAGRMTLTGTVGVETFTPVLAALDDDENDVPDGPYTKRTPIFELSNLTLPSGTGQLLLQGKTFNVTLTGVDVDVVAGAYAGKANSIAGALTLNGEPVQLVPAFDSAFSQSALDASYTSCDAKVIPVAP